MKGWVLNVHKVEKKIACLQFFFKINCLQGHFQPTAQPLSSKSLPVSEVSGIPFVTVCLQWGGKGPLCLSEVLTA